MFRNRREAGAILASHCAFLRDEQPVVLALPRGGVPVARQVARALDAPWDVLVVGKIGAPGQPELAVGAIGEGGLEVWDSTSQRMFDQGSLTLIAARVRREVAAKVATFRCGRPMVDIRDRVVVIVDDGLATGSTMAAAVSVCRKSSARRVIVAAPVGSTQAVRWMRRVADDVICPSIPESFIAVGQHYADFTQVSDREVTDALTASSREGTPYADDDASLRSRMS